MSGIVGFMAVAIIFFVIFVWIPVWVFMGIIRRRKLAKAPDATRLANVSCSRCSKELKDVAAFCPYCGEKIAAPSQHREYSLSAALGMAIKLCLTFFILFILYLILLIIVDFFKSI